MTTIDAGYAGWTAEEWVRDLFDRCPSIASLAERTSSGGGFHFDFAVVVRLTDGTFRHHLLQWHDFNYNSIRSLVSRLLARFCAELSVDSRWLDGAEFRDARVVINRSKLGMEEAPPPLTLSSPEFEEVMQQHGDWMLGVFRMFPQIELIGRRAKVDVSPNTYMFRRISEHDTLFTWMKEPTVDRVQTRMKFEPKRWDRCTGAELSECRLLITRDDVFAYYKTDNDLEAARKMLGHELEKQGRFRLRILAQKLGMLDTEAGRSAFIAMGAREQAVELFKKLNPPVTGLTPREVQKCAVCTAEACHHNIKLDGYLHFGARHYCGACVGLPNATLGRRLLELEVEREREERIAQGHERRQPARDRYAAAREELKQKLIANGHRCVDDPEQTVAAAMAAENHAGDAWAPDEPTHAGRLLAGLEGEIELKRVRRSTKFDPRPGIDDVGLGGSGPGWED